MNVPKLRFKEFTDEWQEHKLKDFTVPVKRKNTNNESDLPLTISSLDGLVDQRTYFNKVVASKDMSNYYLLKKGEFAYNKSYSVGFPFGSIKRLDKYNQGALSSLYICFQVNNMNSDFTVKYFESPKWHKQISLCVAEGARNHGLLNVNINDFFSTKHFFPQLKEQQKIANFLSTVDKKISNLEDIVTNLENQKKGLLQQIFNQGIRFKDENGKNSYTSYHLHNLIKDIKSGNNKERTETGLYPVYGSMGILGYNNNYVYNFTSLLIARVGINAGKVSLVTGKYDVSDNTLIIIPSNKVNIYYLYYYLINFNLNKLVFGSGQPLIKASELKKIIIQAPCLEEQTKIADFLSAFDRKINNQKAQLEHWKQIKKGLLQQMFV